MEALTDGDMTSDLMRVTGGAGRRGSGAGAGWPPTPPMAEGRIQRAFASGQAAETFGEMVAELGGPADFVDRWRDRLPAAKVMVDIHPGETGYVAAIDARALGEAVVRLGGGR